MDLVTGKLAEYFSRNTLDPVALYRKANVLFGYNQTQSVMGAFAAPGQEQEIPV